MKKTHTSIRYLRNIILTAIIILLCAFIIIKIFFLHSLSPFNNSKSIGVKKFTIISNVARFLPYIDIFNSSHQKKAVFIYKEDPLSTLQKGVTPDIIIAPWLRNDKTKNHFQKLNNITGSNSLSRVYSPLFYDEIANSGALGDDQYLLPISFNVPVIIFSRENTHYINEVIGNRQTITIEEIKNISSNYSSAMASLQNKPKNDSKTPQPSAVKSPYISAFSPQSSDDFLYFYTKILGSMYKESDSEMPFSYSNEKLDSAINLLKDWESLNGGVVASRNYVYKYLSKPDDKKVTSGYALFAFTTSDKLFCYTPDIIEKIDYRYITYNNAIPVEDNLVMMGLPKGSRSKGAALDFLEWFFNIETQEKLLKEFNALNLDIKTFGIAGGYSAIKDVNENILPKYYKTLRPLNKSFIIYEQKPYNYQLLKTSVIIPYIKDKLLESEKCKSIEDRYKEIIITNPTQDLFSK